MNLSLFGQLLNLTWGKFFTDRCVGSYMTALKGFDVCKYKVQILTAQDIEIYRSFHEIWTRLEHTCVLFWMAGVPFTNMD